MFKAFRRAMMNEYAAYGAEAAVRRRFSSALMAFSREVPPQAAR
jgi:hypothetical protein